MQKIKKENGITLVALVVTIIVLLILSTITIDLGVDSVNSVKDRNLQAELEIVQQAVMQEYTKAIELNYVRDDATSAPANFVGTKISGIPTTSTSVTWALTATEANSKPYKSYYTLTPDNLKNLKVDNSDYTYIVNYYTGEVFNKTKEVTSGNKALYINASAPTDTQKETDTTSFNEGW